MQWVLKMDTSVLVDPNYPGHVDAGILRTARTAHPGLEDEIREVLDTERNRTLLTFMPRGEIRWGRYTLVVEDYCIVTLYPTNTENPGRTHRAKGRGKRLHRKELLRALRNGELDEHTE
jgi:hypothetical protein